MLNLDSLGGCSYCKNLMWRSKIRRALKTWWLIIYQGWKFQKRYKKVGSYDDTFSDERILALLHAEISPWFANIANYLVVGIIPSELTFKQKKRFLVEVKQYFWDDPILFKQCADQIIRRCVPKSEMGEILNHYHSLKCGGHFNGQQTSAKVLQSGFYWPSLFKDAHFFAKSCDRCQMIGNIGRQNEMPLTNVLEVEWELFDVWGIDFMGPFPSSYGYKYILLAVDYVSKWVEVIPTTTCDAKVVLSFIQQNILS